MRRTEGYASGVTDEEWALVELLLPAVSEHGRPLKADLRRVFDAIQYMLAMVSSDNQPGVRVIFVMNRMARPLRYLSA